MIHAPCARCCAGTCKGIPPTAARWGALGGSGQDSMGVVRVHKAPPRRHTRSGCVEDKFCPGLHIGWVDSSTGLHVRMTVLLVAMAIMRSIRDHITLTGEGAVRSDIYLL